MNKVLRILTFCVGVVMCFTFKLTIKSESATEILADVLLIAVYYGIAGMLLIFPWAISDKSDKE